MNGAIGNANTPSCIPNSNNNNQQQPAQQNFTALARIVPAVDAKVLQVDQAAISRFYPISVPSSTLGDDHGDIVRMFTPDRYLLPRGTFYMPEAPHVQMPENVGSSTTGKWNRCRTCFKALADHTSARDRNAPLRLQFPCPDPCAFAAICPSHPHHPGQVGILHSRSECTTNFATSPALSCT